jgi:hypothetical protein
LTVWVFSGVSFMVERLNSNDVCAYTSWRRSICEVCRASKKDIATVIIDTLLVCHPVYNIKDWTSEFYLARGLQNYKHWTQNDEYLGAFAVSMRTWIFE